MSKRAVLNGINAYQDPNVSDLAGCVNDIGLVAEVLTSHHGFDSTAGATAPRRSSSWARWPGRTSASSMSFAYRRNNVLRNYT